MEEPKKKSGLRKYLVLISLGIVVGLGTWMYFRYWYVYSSGTRVGIIQKFSEKGYMFKTHEGEMILRGMGNKNKQTGTFSSNNFLFSVTDDALAEKLSNAQGMMVEIHYVNYNNSLPWRGDFYSDEDGQYIVDNLVRIVDENPDWNGGL